MRPRNLISVYQGNEAIEASGLTVEKRFNELKKHEIRNMRSFCEIMLSDGCNIGNLDGFFVSYSIAQIGKEFDLLRFGTDFVLNIEIKSELKVAKKESKILNQLQKNHYYLKFLGKPLIMFSYVENDGFYYYDISNNAISKVDSTVAASSIINQHVDYSIDPDKIFIPSNYLISPFNSTDAFINGEYFLTTAQQKIKDEIFEDLYNDPFMFFCITANAGTGKTLLMYDIAKDLNISGKKTMIIHCGKLNQGHDRLVHSYNWNIISIKNISYNKDFINISGIDYIFVDESQRIRDNQISALVAKAIELKIPIFFSFDTKQYLRTGETLDIVEYLSANYPSVRRSTKKLTNKIRTNKSMASFITNLFDIGKSHDNLNYNSITIEYFSDYSTAKEYLNHLKTINWHSITYTTSTVNEDPYEPLAELCDKNAHDVIGQEFSKVAFVMDKNFRYSEEGKLQVRNSYYSARGMLYQIVTRVVDELKIIVVNNPALYEKLLEIKAMETL